eukprot:2969034-Amphidinium_carterae.1
MDQSGTSNYNFDLWTKRVHAANLLGSGCNRGNRGLTSRTGFIRLQQPTLFPHISTSSDA